MTILTLQHCVICLTKCHSSDQGSIDNCDGLSRERMLERKRKVEVCHRFCTIASRHLKLDPSFFLPDRTIRTKWSVSITYACDNCVPMLESFCESYQKLQQLQLEITRTQEKIANAITKADEGNHGGCVRDRDELERKLISIGGSIQVVDNFRSNFKKQAQKNCRRTFPLLKLTRTKATESNLSLKTFERKPASEVIVSSLGQDSDDDESDDEDLFSPVWIKRAKVKVENDPLPDSSPNCEKAGQLEGSKTKNNSKTVRFSLENNNNEQTIKNEDTLLEMTGGKKKSTCVSARDLSATKFSCRYCHTVSVSQYHHDVHLKVHTEERPYSCNKCPMSFKSLGNLTNHRRWHGRRSKTSKGTRIESTNVEATTIPNDTDTDKFGNSFGESKSILRRILYQPKQEMEGSERRLPVLEVKSSFPQQLKSDEKHGVSENKAKVDPSDAGELQAAPSRTLLVCPFCSMKQLSQQHFDRHLRKHTGERPYFCKTCPLTFPSIANVARHQMVQHRNNSSGSGSGALNKKSLPKNAFSRNSLRIVQATLNSTSTARFLSSKYSKSPVIDNPKKRRHLKLLHGGGAAGAGPKGRKRKLARFDNHVCNYCGTCFRDKFALEVHIRKHTGYRPHKCPLCSKRFKQQSHLNQHARTHTGVKPYKCSLCLKSFRQQTTLKNHVRLHFGVKPFSCVDCPERFTQVACLNDHIKRRHGGLVDLTTKPALSDFVI